MVHLQRVTSGMSCCVAPWQSVGQLLSRAPSGGAPHHALPVLWLPLTFFFVEHLIGVRACCSSPLPAVKMAKSRQTTGAQGPAVALILVAEVTQVRVLRWAAPVLQLREATSRLAAAPSPEVILQVAAP